MSVKLGLIGVGAIGQTHLAAAKAAGVEVAGLADINDKLGKRIGAEHKIPLVTDDPHELIKSDSIDAVIVGVPNKLHAPLTIAALEAGKDVLVEKPMAMNVEQCRQMNAAAKKHNRILQVGFVSRYSAVGAAAKKYVDAGRLGHVYHVKTAYYRRRGIPGLGGWFTTKAMSGGGPLIDLGVHLIDLAMYLMGSPKPVRVSGKVYANFGPRMKDYVYESMWAGPPNYSGVFDVEDAAHALVRFNGGTTLELNTTWAGNFCEDALPGGIALFGDRAGLSFKLGGSALRIATEDQGHNVDITPALRTAEQFREQVTYFAGCVENRRQPHANGASGELVQSIIDAIYESSRLDREVEM